MNFHSAKKHLPDLAQGGVVRVYFRCCQVSMFTICCSIWLLLCGDNLPKLIVLVLSKMAVVRCCIALYCKYTTNNCDLPLRWIKNVNIINYNQYVVSALIVGNILAMCIVIAMMVVGVGQKK